MTVFFKFVLAGMSAHVLSFLFFWVSSVWGALIVSPCFFLTSENFDHEDSRVARFFWLGTECEHIFEFRHDEAGARDSPPYY